MGIRQKEDTNKTYVSYVATTNYGNRIDSKASDRDYTIKQHMVNEFDRMTKRVSS